MTAQIAAYGRLGRDPRQHETKSGKPMASASLAVTVEAREGWQVIADSVVSSRSVRPGGGRRKGDGGEVRDRRERSPGEPFDDALPF